MAHEELGRVVLGVEGRIVSEQKQDHNEWKHMYV